MKKFLALVLFAAIIAAVIWLLMHFGILGKGTGSGKGDNSTSVSDSADKNEPTTAEEAIEVKTEENTDIAKEEVLEISISKNEYLYDNNMLSLDDLAKIISGKNKDILIEITIDDTAAKNTVDELTDKLDELGYKNYKKTEK